MPEPLGDAARVFVAVMVAGGILLGWFNNRGRRDRWGDGTDSDDGGWWGFGDADGGPSGDGGGDAGDGGH